MTNSDTQRNILEKTQPDPDPPGSHQPGSNRTIPVSGIVNVSPDALSVAGGVDFMNGLLLTQSSVIAKNMAQSFTSYGDVARTFTPASIEAQMAEIYFSGFIGTNQTPARLYFYGVGPAGEDFDPTILMENVTSITQDFAGFTTTWEPLRAQKQAFALWNGGQNARYWYVPFDSAPSALARDGSAFGSWLKLQAIDGTTIVYKDPLTSALCLGWMASLDFNAINGRTSLALRRNRLVSPVVDDALTARILLDNGYNFFGAYGSELEHFQFLEDGSVSGQFLWADSYINQIWLHASFRSDLLNLLLAVGQIPYNTRGDRMISAAVQNTINQALAFGAIREGVHLTRAQRLQIDNEAGASISGTVEERGWYFQSNASNTPAATRVKRGSPPCRFWYTDGQSVQSIHLSDVEVQ